MANSRSKSPREGSALVDAYLAAVPPQHRKTLDRIRAIIRKAAPAAEEEIGYGIPIFRYKGRPLVSFGASKAHAGFYGMSPAVHELFADELMAYETSKGTVRLPYGAPVPADLITRIVKARMAETDAKPAKR